METVVICIVVVVVAIVLAVAFRGLSRRSPGDKGVWGSPTGEDSWFGGADRWEAKKPRTPSPNRIQPTPDPKAESPEPGSPRGSSESDASK